MRALWDSIVRTVVPIVVGAVVTWAVTAGIELDDQLQTTLTVALTGLFTGVYYVIVRLFETYVSPKFGWLLGLARAPKYEPKHAA